jgi:hypothetical protein
MFCVFNLSREREHTVHFLTGLYGLAHSIAAISSYLLLATFWLTSPLSVHTLQELFNNHCRLRYLSGVAIVLCCEFEVAKWITRVSLSNVQIMFNFLVRHARSRGGGDQGKG